MSQFSYEAIDHFILKQRELADFLQQLRSGPRKKFHYDITSKMRTPAGEQNVYSIMKEKLEEMLSLKEQLPPEAHDLIVMAIGPGTRFDQWLAEQREARDHTDFKRLQDTIIGPKDSTPFTPKSSEEASIKEYIHLHQQAYIGLQTIGIYIQRLQQSTNIAKENKVEVAAYAAQLLELANYLKSLDLEKLSSKGPEAFIQGLSKLYRSEKFMNFLHFANSIDLDHIKERLGVILDINKKFNLHLPTMFNFKHLKQCLKDCNLNSMYQNGSLNRLLDIIPGSEDAKRSLKTNVDHHAGQDDMRSKIFHKKINPLEFILSLDTEYPCYSIAKSMDGIPNFRGIIIDDLAAYRSGLLEEALIHLCPESCRRVESKMVVEGHTISALGIEDQGIIHPHLIDGEYLLNRKSTKDEILDTILAAISPVTKDRYGIGFSPQGKLSAYAKLIQAIDDKQLSISDKPLIEQKRDLAERALFIMVKYNLPQDNPDFQAINASIESSKGAKAAKALGKMFGKKQEETVKTRPIQKLFREYPGKPKYTIEDLGERIVHPSDYPAATVAIPHAEVGVVGAGAGAGAGAGGSEMAGYRTPAYSASNRGEDQTRYPETHPHVDEPTLTIPHAASDGESSSSLYLSTTSESPTDMDVLQPEGTSSPLDRMSEGPAEAGKGESSDPKPNAHTAAETDENPAKLGLRQHLFSGITSFDPTKLRKTRAPSSAGEEAGAKGPLHQKPGVPPSKKQIFAEALAEKRREMRLDDDVEREDAPLSPPTAPQLPEPDDQAVAYGKQQAIGEMLSRRLDWLPKSGDESDSDPDSEFSDDETMTPEGKS